MAKIKSIKGQITIYITYI